MQVFVRRSGLTLAANEAVPVMGYYEDTITITPDMRRPEFALLSLAPSAVVSTQQGVELAPGWRETNRAQILSGEAERRILEAFPDHSQRNSAVELMGYIVAHGANSATWPAAVQRRKGEIDRAWAYVSAVRAAAKGMSQGALAADPTANSHWPADIAAYQPS